MTYEEAQQIAISAGALEPQGTGETLANVDVPYGWSLGWKETPRAQARLAAWTDALLNGVPPHQLKRRIG